MPSARGDGFGDRGRLRAVRVGIGWRVGGCSVSSAVGQTEQQGGLALTGRRIGFRRAVLEKDAAFVHDGVVWPMVQASLSRVGHEDGGDVLFADAFRSGAQVAAQVGVGLGKASSKSNSDGRAIRRGARGEALLFRREAFGFTLRFVFQTDVAQRPAWIVLRFRLWADGRI